MMHLYNIWNRMHTTPGIWTHDILPINFTLAVNNFVMEYAEKEYALHFKEVLETKYKVSTDWEDKPYAIIYLTWDYDKGTVQLDIPGYVRTLLHSFQHENKKEFSTHHTPGTHPSMAITIIF